MTVTMRGLAEQHDAARFRKISGGATEMIRVIEGRMCQVNLVHLRQESEIKLKHLAIQFHE